MIHPTDAAIAVLLGGALGAGLWCIAAAAPGWRAPTLVVRIAPYIRDVTDPSGRTLPQTIADPTLVLAGGMSTAWRRAQRRFATIAGRSEAIELRLAQAGRGHDVAAFRGNQLAWALVGGAIATALVALLVATDRFSAAALVLPAVGAVGGFIARDVALTSRARARVARIEEELPTVLEFLSLCLAAGEGILGSVRRVATVGSGELTAELRAVTIDVDTGTPLTDALTTMAHRLRAPVLTRACDHVIAAIDRGSPLAETLQAQAADARDDAKRRLIETAGRKEIFMLLPVVFGLLPLSVLFAIFPGVTMLQFGF